MPARTHQLNQKIEHHPNVCPNEGIMEISQESYNLAGALLSTSQSLHIFHSSRLLLIIS
jgi:hypothetical protein